MAADRHCGSCTLCCKVMAVHGVPKPARTWCQHCAKGSGCGIYADRPQDCRDFMCLYLEGGAALGEHWFPARSKMIVRQDASIPRIEVHVDDSRPNAWRADPFYSEIKAWARAAAKDSGQILVCLPDRTIVVLPNKDVDLGKLQADDRIAMFEHVTPSGPVPDAMKIKADDPRARNSGVIAP